MTKPQGMDVLSSRQRLLNAFNHQPVDHVPLLLRFWSLGGKVDTIPFNWRDDFQRLEHTLALGLDDTLTLQPPLGYVEDYVAENVPGVSSEVTALPAGTADRYPQLRKTYFTPAGMLRTAVKVSDDWPHGEQIYLFDDYNLSRLQEPLIKDRSDVPALRCLLGDPSTWQVDEFRTRAAAYRETAARLGVLLEGGWSSLGDSLMWLLGIERVLYLQTDDPRFLEEILDILLEWELKRLEYLLAEGIDVLVHMAWYETTDFWTPRNWRRLLKPRLFQLIQKAHSHGVKFRYIITKSWKPYRQDYLELGIDCLTGLDPVQDTVDLEEVKQQIGEQICLMGGVNSAVMLSQWNKSQIRWAVEHAIRSLSPGGGFILHPVDAVFNNQPWEKILYLIDCWRSASLRG